MTPFDIHITVRVPPKPSPMSDIYFARKTAMSCILPIIEDTYEDACYELAYDLKPSIDLCLKPHKMHVPITNLLKLLLKSDDFYRKIKKQYDNDQYNNTEYIQQVREYEYYCNEYANTYKIFTGYVNILSNIYKTYND